MNSITWNQSLNRYGLAAAPVPFQNNSVTDDSLNESTSNMPYSQGPVTIDSTGLWVGGQTYEDAALTISSTGSLTAAQASIADLNAGNTWIEWFPIITTSAGSLSGVSSSARYFQIGTYISYQLGIQCTLSGGPAVSIRFTLPTTSVGGAGGAGNFVSTVDGQGSATVGAISGTVSFIAKSDFTGFNNAALQLNAFGNYQAL